MSQQCQVCRNQTLDPSGRCYLHLSARPSAVTTSYAIGSNPPSTSTTPPTEVTYHSDGSVESEGWHKEGELHRLDGPAVVWHRKEGSVQTEAWFEGGDVHRLDGPAMVSYREDGGVWIEEWYEREKRHRLDGPAIVWYYEDGGVEKETWWYEDEEMSPETVALISSGVPYEWAAAHGESQS